MADSTRAPKLDDTTLARALAANCLLYENDPGPARLNIGSVDEPRMVRRSYAWQDFYAHSLLQDLDGDHKRLTALAEVLRAEMPHDPARKTLRQRLTRRGRPTAWQRALDLCELAIRIVEEAGAVDDDRARRRLVAGARHLSTVTALGIVPGVAEQSAQDLIEELDAIDAEDTGPAGGSS